MEAVLGRPPEGWMAPPGPWKASLHPDDIDRATEETLAAAGDGTEDRLVTIEYRMFTKEGRMGGIRGESTVVHDEDGPPLCLQGVLYDISDSKRAVEERDFQAR